MLPSKGKNKSTGFTPLFASIFIVALGITSWKSTKILPSLSPEKRLLQEVNLLIASNEGESNQPQFNSTNTTNDTLNSPEWLADPILLEDTYVRDGYEESNKDAYEMVIETTHPSFGLIKFDLPEEHPDSVIGSLLRLKVSNVHSCSGLSLRVRKLAYYNSWYEENATYCTTESLLDTSITIGAVDIFQPEPIEGLHRIGDSDFYMSKDLLSWSDHLAQAASFGMTLASIRSKEEQKLIFEFMASDQNSDSFGVWTGGKRNYYNPLQWEWTDGCEFKFTNWAPGQPSNNGMEHPFDQDRLMLGGTGFWPKGVWHDKQGAHKRYALYSWTEEGKAAPLAARHCRAQAETSVHIDVSHAVDFVQYMLGGVSFAIDAEPYVGQRGQSKMSFYTQDYSNTEFAPKLEFVEQAPSAMPSMIPAPSSAPSMTISLSPTVSDSLNVLANTNVSINMQNISMSSEQNESSSNQTADQGSIPPPPNNPNESTEERSNPNESAEQGTIPPPPPPPPNNPNETTEEGSIPPPPPPNNPNETTEEGTIPPPPPPPNEDNSVEVNEGLGENRSIEEGSTPENTDDKLTDTEDDDKSPDDDIAEPPSNEDDDKSPDDDIAEPPSNEDDDKSPNDDIPAPPSNEDDDKSPNDDIAEPPSNEDDDKSPNDDIPEVPTNEDDDKSPNDDIPEVPTNEDDDESPSDDLPEPPNNDDEQENLRENRSANNDVTRSPQNNEEVSLADCIVENPSWLGDGLCDAGFYSSEECQFDQGDCIPQMRSVGDDIEGDFKYREPALAFDGSIYAMPSSARRILKVNPLSGTTAFVGDDQGDDNFKFSGTVGGLDGNIYGIPNQATYILKYDPFRDFTSRVAEDNEILLNSNQHQFSHGVSSTASGGIYFIPYFHEKVVKFNPFNPVNPLEEIGDDFGSDWKWWGGVEAGDDNIYAIPGNGEKVLKINVMDDTVELIGESYPKTYSWMNGALASDGNIYACPYDAPQILQINVNTQTTSLVGPDLGNEQWKWSGFVEGSDGFLYGIPRDANTLLRFDPVTKAASKIPLDRTVSDLRLGKWQSGVLANDSTIYAIPYSEEKVLAIPPLALKATEAPK